MNTKTLKMPEPQLLYYQMGEHVTAFSSTRHGGCGQGRYGSFNVNLYCGDDPDSIARNRTLLCRELGIAEDALFMPHQVHGTTVVQVTPDLVSAPAALRQETLEGADALMTDVKGICIGVSTADCIPIIIYDPDHEAACVVHAGWRGTVQRIARTAVLAMLSSWHSRPERLQAVIGPGISLESFEVGDEVYEQFREASFPMEHVSRRMPAMNGATGERWHIDLWECNRMQLHALGLIPSRIHVSGICTYQQSDDFFSARKLGVESGRILTGVVLR